MDGYKVERVYLARVSIEELLAQIIRRVILENNLEDK